MLDQQERTAVTHAAPGSQRRAVEEDGDPLVAFSARQVRELTGLSEYQLRSWDQAEFLSLPHPNSPRRKLPGRIYRFRDVVILRAIAMLRNDCHVKLSEVRKAARWLKEHVNTSSSLLRLIVKDRHIILDDSDAAVESQPDGGQPGLSIELATVEREMRARALQSRERMPEEIGKITRRRSVESNAWVLAGTRVPTEAVWNFHQAGHTTAAILAAYPTLTPVDIQRAIEFEQGRRHKQASQTDCRHAAPVRFVVNTMRTPASPYRMLASTAGPQRRSRLSHGPKLEW
jgi:uncharacterized protein (DUF433 family)